ncbi:MAG: hypothetical protein KGL48_00545 [Sphingomonadales bacterium]|nr:hypothetical protein [Sphingomonadales bacterium]MDE2567862.1 hypothetical protein [Sphingomonadales bacterium]
MRRLLSLVCAALCLIGTPALAQQVTTRSWTDAQGVRWTETTTTEVVEEDPGAERYVATDPAARPRGLANFGPFVVTDPSHAALVDATDSYSPADFARMLAAWPGIRTLEMPDCPGTVDDTANLRLGRMIRAHGIATDVPKGGSVRSGAVELFLAGATRHAAPDAEFAVHSWLDDAGKQPRDYAPTDPVNATYLAYYREMGLSAEEAKGFYALTNSVPYSRVLWLHTADVARYAALN